MSDKYRILNGIFSEEGVTHCFDVYTDLSCRERGFINDPRLNEEETSRALRNYFEDGRFYEELMPSPQTNLPYQISLMEEWIETYREYLNEPDLKAVQEYYEKIKKGIK